jgi:hypothetical protein
VVIEEVRRLATAREPHKPTDATLQLAQAAAAHRRAGQRGRIGPVIILA